MQASLRWLGAPRASEGRWPHRVSADAQVGPAAECSGRPSYGEGIPMRLPTPGTDWYVRLQVLQEDTRSGLGSTTTLLITTTRDLVVCATCSLASTTTLTSSAPYTSTHHHAICCDPFSLPLHYLVQVTSERSFLTLSLIHI